VICLTFAFNAIHLEAARRLRLAKHPQEGGRHLPELLLYEPRRMRLTQADRHLWPLRLPVTPLVMAALVPPALLGLVEEVRLPHLCQAGRALRLVVRRAQGISLLDDGLDQYRERPRALDPLRFPPGTPCWLFSDAPAFRAPWCRRFDCRELGPLYGDGEPGRAEPSSDDPTDPLPGGAWAGSLIVDAPGLERVGSAAARLLPHPWRVVPHPVRTKRSWALPPSSGDVVAEGQPEDLIRRCRGVVLVGESMTLLAALRLRLPGVLLLVALPAAADPNLWRMVRHLAGRDPSVELL
jgi:hypothetical protein